MSDSKEPQAIPTGAERELQIYALGLRRGKPSVPVPLHLLEQKAKEILAPRAYDYVAGGAGGEDTMRANREAFYRWRIVPRMLRDVAWRAVACAGAAGAGRRAGNCSWRGGHGERACGVVAGTAVCAEHDVEPVDRGGSAVRGKSRGVAAVVSIVWGEKSGADGLHGAARGTRWIYCAGRHTGHPLAGLARARPSSWLLAIYAGARSRELFQRPGFSRAAGATAGAESDGGDSALGQLVFESGAHVEGYRTSAAAHTGADHPQRNIVCP